MVDEMENFDKVFQKDGSLKLLTTEDIRRAKEDRSRLAGGAGSYIIYKLDGKGSGNYGRLFCRRFGEKH